MLARRSTPDTVSAKAEPNALFLSESTDGLGEGAHFLDRLSPAERLRLRSWGRQLAFGAGELIFAQGTEHVGIYLIESGRVRVFYTAPSGREITLAYWACGHFIGGPGIRGGSPHVWSGQAMEECRVTLLPGSAIQTLVTQMPNFALALIDGLVAKGKCYSAMAQMLGTRSVIERLAQFLVNLAQLDGTPDGNAVVINRKITHDEIAAMVGSTRQWVTMMLSRFKTDGIVSTSARAIRIDRPDALYDMLFRERS